MNCKNESDWDKSLGSSNTDNSQASLLRILFLDVQNVLCPRCRNRRRNARCQRSIEECTDQCSTAHDDRSEDLDQNQDRDRDRDLDWDGDGEEDGDGDGDGDGDTSTCWVQYLSRDHHRSNQSRSLSSESPRTRQRASFGLQWLHPLELALYVAGGLVLLSLLGTENLETLLPFFFLFVLYVLFTMPLAKVLGSKRPSPKQIWRQY
ncbi:uncharacterized protein LOC110221113 [Phascolarctos cinereus]|uniref:Uncharacterized protein LOC110221113 n=1 Tax=Phascolarctos cinereus TaxID=38626 RepID=A0A6P5LYN1_PHACI|nr:uncharacterized protein LOC110221113 [Phascolarctos cinereus]